MPAQGLSNLPKTEFFLNVPKTEFFLRDAVLSFGSRTNGGGGSAELIEQRRQAAVAEQQQRKEAGLSRKRNRYAVSDVRSCLSLLWLMRVAAPALAPWLAPYLTGVGVGAVQEEKAEFSRKLKKAHADRTPVSAVVALAADARCLLPPSHPGSPPI